MVVLSTSNKSHPSPSHAVIPKGTAGLTVASKALTEQIKAVYKRRLVRRLGTLPVHLLAQDRSSPTSARPRVDAPAARGASHIEHPSRPRDTFD